MSGFLRLLGATAAVSAAVLGLAFVLVWIGPYGGLKLTQWLSDPVRSFGLILPILWIVVLAGTFSVLRQVSRRASATVLTLIGVLLVHILLSVWRADVFSWDFLCDAPITSNAHLALYVFGGSVAIYWATFAVRVAGPASAMWMAAGLLVIIAAVFVIGTIAYFAITGRTGGTGRWTFLAVKVLLGISALQSLALGCLSFAMIRSAPRTTASGNPACSAKPA